MIPGKHTLAETSLSSRGTPRYVNITDTAIAYVEQPLSYQLDFTGSLTDTSLAYTVQPISYQLDFSGALTSTSTAYTVNSFSYTAESIATLGTASTVIDSPGIGYSAPTAYEFEAAAITYEVQDILMLVKPFAAGFYYDTVPRAENPNSGLGFYNNVS